MPGVERSRYHGSNQQKTLGKEEPMKNYRLFTQTTHYSGPAIGGVTAAKKELAAIVRHEKELARRAGYKPRCFWAPDRLDCVISLGPDKRYSPLWDRLCMVEE